MHSLFIIISSPERRSWAQSVQALAPQAQHHLLAATPLEAASYLDQHRISLSHIILDIGMRGQDVLGEIDQLAQRCEPGTRVIAVGDTNDVQLYRGMVSRGIIDYLPMPAAPAELIRLLTAAPTVAVTASSAPREKRVIAFLSAASGDGASTAALNTAYAISQLSPSQTVLVDMDYQFGMVAKNLNLKNQYGIGDLFDNPDRGVDGTLIKRMVVTYGRLDVITAPADLRYLPQVSAEAIRDLVSALTVSHDQVILDLPHVWLPWVTAAAQQSTQVVMVAQLWLKSVSHAARMMRMLRELGIGHEKVVPVINRSGARFKEAIEPKDFERVCGTSIRYTLANEIRSIVNAEAAAKTVMEMEPGDLANDITRLARALLGLPEMVAAEPAGKLAGGMFAKLLKG